MERTGKNSNKRTQFYVPMKNEIMTNNDCL